MVDELHARVIVLDPRLIAETVQRTGNPEGASFCIITKKVNTQRGENEETHAETKDETNMLSTKLI
jgi:hypothetical protein